MNPTCPIPITPQSQVQLAHGEGGRLMRQLIRQEVLARFPSSELGRLGDAAVLAVEEGELAFSTDGYVVSPLFFPGGDIGKLAVHGTVNDLAMLGAVPLYLSLGLIIEEGLSLDTLRRVLQSVADAASACGVQVVTGDTKVVPRRSADGLFLHTSGIGRIRPGINLDARHCRPGDAILVNGTIGDHGMAVLAAREGLAEGLQSDTAPLHDLVQQLLNQVAHIRFLRDATRGGVSAVLHELAEAAGVCVRIEETAVPIHPAVRGACELLGLDPLHVANEGKLIAVVAAQDAALALEVMRQHPLGRQAARIGEVLQGTPGEVQVRGAIGRLRVLDEPAGAPLPRIC
jgi:hydrogenase expression/formation protein HypE